jgi:hypothetical protein
MPPPDLDLHPEARAARGSMSPNDPSRVSWGIGSTLAAILYVNGASLRRFERRHDFKRMEREFPRCPRRSAGTIGVGHFGRAESAQTEGSGRALHIGVVHRDAPPVGVALAEQLDTAGEGIRIGRHERALSAVKLDVVVLMLGDVEARGDRDRCAVLELNDARGMSRHFDLDDFPAPRLAEDDSFAAGSLGESHRAARWPQSAIRLVT